MESKKIRHEPSGPENHRNQRNCGTSTEQWPSEMGYENLDEECSKVFLDFFSFNDSKYRILIALYRFYQFSHLIFIMGGVYLVPGNADAKMLTKFTKFIWAFPVVPILIYTSIYAINKSALLKAWKHLAITEDTTTTINKKKKRIHQLPLHVISEFILSLLILIIGVVFYIVESDPPRIASCIFIVFNIRSMDPFLVKLYMRWMKQIKGDALFLDWIHVIQKRNANNHRIFQRHIKRRLRQLCGVMALVMLVVICICL